MELIRVNAAAVHKSILARYVDASCRGIPTENPLVTYTPYKGNHYVVVGGVLALSRVKEILNRRMIDYDVVEELPTKYRVLPSIDPKDLKEMIDSIPSPPAQRVGRHRRGA